MSYHDLPAEYGVSPLVFVEVVVSHWFWLITDSRFRDSNGSCFVVVGTCQWVEAVELWAVG